MLLTEGEKSRLLGWYESELRKIVKMDPAMRSSSPLDWVSGCLTVGLSPESYEDTREGDKEFAQKCAKWERYRDQVVGGVAMTGTLIGGKAADKLALAKARDPETFQEPKDKQGLVINILTQLPDREVAEIECETQDMLDRAAFLLLEDKKRVQHLLTNGE